MTGLDAVLYSIAFAILVRTLQWFAEVFSIVRVNFKWDVVDRIERRMENLTSRVSHVERMVEPLAHQYAPSSKFDLREENRI